MQPPGRKFADLRMAVHQVDLAPDRGGAHVPALDLRKTHAVVNGTALDGDELAELANESLLLGPRRDDRGLRLLGQIRVVVDGPNDPVHADALDGAFVRIDPRLVEA